MVLITQYAHRTWFQHHGQPCSHFKAEPALGKRSQRMSMRNDNHISWSRAPTPIQIRRLNLSNPRNQRIKPRRNLCRRLTAFAAIPPDIPRTFFVVALLASACFDLSRQETLVCAVLPLSDVFGGLNFTGLA
jgi:hypothetical protein